MAVSAETIDDPFTAFSFDVVLTLATPLPGIAQPVCHGAFSECDGLQIDLEPRSVAEGGVTDAVTHLMGHSRAGQITLRRGMTATADLWSWMAAAGVPGRTLTADGQITMLSPSGAVQARFLLAGCLPVRLRGPALHAHTGMIAIEELGLAVGRLTLAGAGGGAGDGVSIGGGLSIGIGAGFSAGGQVSGGLGLSGGLGGTLSGTATAGATASLTGGLSGSASAGFGGGS